MGSAPIEEAKRMLVLRAIAAALLFVTAALLVRDGIVSVQAGAWSPMALGQLWANIDRSSLLLLQPAVERYVAEWLWDPVIFTLLQWPSWVTIGGLGLLLLLLSFWRRGERRRFGPR